MIIVVCSFIHLYTSEACIAYNMDLDQTTPKGSVWSGFIVFASMIKSSLKWTWILAADNIFRTKIIGRVRVNQLRSQNAEKITHIKGRLL